MSHQSSETRMPKGEPVEFHMGMPPRGGWDNAPDIEAAKHYCRDMRFTISRGRSGIETCKKIAGHLHDLGISDKMAIKLILKYAEPLLPEDRLREEIEHYYRVIVTMPGQLSKAEPRPSIWQPAKEQEDEDPDAWMDAGLNPAVWPCPIEYNTGMNSAQLAEAFLIERPEMITVSDGVIYTLGQNKTWRELPEDELAAEIRATDPTMRLDTSHIFRIISSIRIQRFTKSRPFEWIEPPLNPPEPRDLILFSNGILDFASGDLIPHTGQLFTTGLPDFEYDPKAVCPTWDRCLGEWLDSSFHDTLHEFLGYAMTPDTSLHKMLALIGARRGGKSTVLKVMEWLCGSAHVVPRSLNDLGSDFGLEGCLDAKVMVIPDAHDTELSKRSVALDRLKTITGGDQVSVNRKGLKIVKARVPTRIAIAANRHPKFLDESGALAARELVLVFERSFGANPDYDLADKLRAELPGIANRALAGLRRLRDNGGRFTVGARGQAALRDVAAAQSPALRFANLHLVVTGDPEDCAPIDAVYDTYRLWATEVEHLNGHELRSRQDFKDDLIAALIAQGVVYARRRWHDPRKPEMRRAPRVIGFFGARLKHGSAVS